MKPTITIIAICVICAAMMSGSQACSTVITVREPPELIPVVTNYNETTLATVQHFLDHMEPCPWGGACGMHARYVSIEAENVGLNIDEVTISDWDRNRAKRIVMDGHRVNTFADGDVRYYTTNLYAGDARIVTSSQLYTILKVVIDS